MQLHSTITHAFPYYQTVLLSPDLTELDEEILTVIGVYQPITTKHIASQLSKKQKFAYSRSDINSRLFKMLSGYLVQDEYFRWSLRYEGIKYKGQKEDPEKGHYTEDGNVVNLDSTVKITDLNGTELKIQFTKLDRSKSSGPQDGITYVYYKSPLALALLTRKRGDTLNLVGGPGKVLEVD